ncbi:MAG: UDP-glucose/GDP-mannose dehydrogenase family protein, partial [Desulfobacterales bacterium]|nr:UDP-glucose/GDP-mannose dehydrogenase family protein [Desulfobacterales bacterium]
EVYKKAGNCDAAVLMTAHSEYKDIDLRRLKSAMKTSLVIDGRNLFDKKLASEVGIDLIRLGDSSTK